MSARYAESINRDLVPVQGAWFGIKGTSPAAIRVNRSLMLHSAPPGFHLFNKLQIGFELISSQHSL